MSASLTGECLSPTRGGHASKSPVCVRNQDWVTSENRPIPSRIPQSMFVNRLLWRNQATPTTLPCISWVPGLLFVFLLHLSPSRASHVSSNVCLRGSILFGLPVAASLAKPRDGRRSFFGVEISRGGHAKLFFVVKQFDPRKGRGGVAGYCSDVVSRFPVHSNGG